MSDTIEIEVPDALERWQVMQAIHLGLRKAARAEARNITDSHLSPNIDHEGMDFTFERRQGRAFWTLADEIYEDFEIPPAQNPLKDAQLSDGGSGD